MPIPSDQETPDVKSTQPPPAPNPDAAPDSSTDFVWSFRGYKLRSPEFTTAMVHFFRAEVQRANVWRQRLDTTTNWAVVTTGASLSLAFAATGNHIVIPINIMLVTIFLLIEARRYRYYELWAYRVRLMETDFFAPMLVPPFHPSADWAEALSESLLHPHFPISTLEAVGRRLRRNFLYIYLIIGAAWLLRLWLLPVPVRDWLSFARRAAVGSLNGLVLLSAIALFYAVLVLISIGTVGLQASAGEVLPRFGDSAESLAAGASKMRAWFRPSRRRPQLLTLIITDQRQAVAESILKDMRRGVTSLPGTGMYTGQEHSILLIALTVTEIPQIKALVAAVDPKAFVIVMPAQEILGMGFMPLKENP